MSAPILVSSTPEDNAIDVALDSNIVFNFSEAVFPSTGWVSIHKASDDSMIRYFDARAGQILREFSSQITINPPYDFESSTEYYLLIDSTVFEGFGGFYSGISDKTILNFKTANDNTPKLKHISPSNGMAGLKIDSNLVLTFSEDVFTQRGNIVIHNLSDDSVVETFAVEQSNAITGSGTYTITINPTNNFAKLTSYYLLIDENAFVDADGNSYAGISDKTSQWFTTGNSTTFVNKIKVADVNALYIEDSKGFASITGSAPVTVTSYEIGKETNLDSIKDYDGNLHAGDNLAATASSYKYQGMLDVNGDGVFETIFTNKSSKRWVTAKVDSTTGQIDFDDNGAGGGTRVVGIYADPLIAEGENNGGYLSDGVTPAPANFGVSDADRYVVVNGETIDRLALNSQVRFQNDLEIDNLQAKHSGDYDSDGIHEVYWKTNDGTAYLRSLMHADGNIRYANYQSEAQMNEYLTANGDDSVITDITS